MYSNTILKLDLIVIIIQKYCEKYLKPDKDIDKINKSKTIQFVLDQLSDIRKTKDFKVLKSIFTIEKKHKIKDLKDWLNILCANNFKLFSKHFKLDVEIDMKKGYRTYVNLLSKLENNKTKVDLKESNKQISILFNLLFYDVIVGGGVEIPKRKRKRKKKIYASFKSTQQQQITQQQKKYLKSTSTGKGRWWRIVREQIINPRIEEEYGTEIARDIGMFPHVINVLFEYKVSWLNPEQFRQSLERPSPRPYNKIFPIVQQSHIGSCWINAILVALMYPYHLKREFANIITFLLEEGIKELKQVRTQQKIKEASVARIIQTRLYELLVLQYDSNSTMTEKKCITSDFSFVRDFISILTAIAPDIFKTFSQYEKHKANTPLNKIILEEGGKIIDIFNLIHILLEYGFKFKLKSIPGHFIQLYEKIVHGKKITICVESKPRGSNYLDYVTNGFEFASIILFNFNRSSASPEVSAMDRSSASSEDSAMDRSSASSEDSEMDRSFASSEDSEMKAMSEMLHTDIAAEGEVGHAEGEEGHAEGEGGHAEGEEGHAEEESVGHAEEEEGHAEEESVGHVITILTDNAQELFYYNGWMNGNCVTPLQSTNGRNIRLKTADRETLHFDLHESFGIMISFKLKPYKIVKTVKVKQ